jgi:tetratricopeptide (TPR) repeat protein
LPHRQLTRAGLSESQVTHRKKLWIALAGAVLFALTLAVYWPARHFEFTDYDDQAYVWQNPRVTGGINASGLRWALTTTYFSYWHPLTWMSHQLDCQLFGLNAGRHHLTSVLLHAVNSVLCLLVLGAMTGRWACSAFVAAAFAWHPLHVESVAWIAERKDVLSGLFFFLTLGAYHAYARHGGRLRYGLAVLMFAGGVASKPMLVTVPCLLLLLDYWPLGRLRIPSLDWTPHTGPAPLAPQPWPRLLVEKIPFVLLSALSSVITFIGVRNSGFLVGAETFDWGLRFANVPVSYVRYLGQMLVPENMVFLYPMPAQWAAWQWIGASVVLLFITLGAIAFVQRAPWFLIGWLWYLGMLVPTLNVVAVGFQSIADRYTYLTLTGVFLMAAWTFAALSQRWPRRVWIAGGTAAVVSLALLAGTWRQAQVWRNSVTLFGHAVLVDEDNAAAHYNFGLALLLRGQTDDAARLFRRTIELHQETGQFPAVHKAYSNLGWAMGAAGRWAEATNHLAEALRRRPSDPEANLTFGRALLALNLPERAIPPLELGAAARTNAAEPRLFLGQALARTGRDAEAAPQFRAALQLQPESSPALDALAWLLATSPDASLRNGTEAVSLAQRACFLTRTNDPAPMLTLAAALAETGQFQSARQQAHAALALAARSPQEAVKRRGESILRALELEQPYRGRRED